MGGWHIVAEDEGRMAKFSAHENERRIATDQCASGTCLFSSSMYQTGGREGMCQKRGNQLIIFIVREQLCLF